MCILAESSPQVKCFASETLIAFISVDCFSPWYRVTRKTGRVCQIKINRIWFLTTMFRRPQPQTHISMTQRGQKQNQSERKSNQRVYQSSERPRLWWFRHLCFSLSPWFRQLFRAVTQSRCFRRSEQERAIMLFAAYKLLFLIAPWERNMSVGQHVIMPNTQLNM